jgi:uncharacterized membrane protein
MNWPHIHLLLNHVPVLGTVFGGALLAYGVLRRNETLQRAALWTFVFTALAAIPVYLTGEPAEEAVEHLAGTADRAIEAHEEAALLAFIGSGVLGAIALVGLWKKVLIRTALPVMLVIVGLMAWTANLGGRIRHTVLRQGAVQAGDASIGDDDEAHP